MHRILRATKKAKRKLSIEPSSELLYTRPYKKQKVSSYYDIPLSHQKFNHASYINRRNQFFRKKKIINSKFSHYTYLKQLENKVIPKTRRAIFDFSENYSAALKLAVTDEQLEKYKNNLAALFYFSEKNIEEHAARRVDLFFYTLVAYWNTQFKPMQSWTKLQHGRGRHDVNKKTITAACHSSLIPAFVDETIKYIISRNVKYADNFCISLLSATHFKDSLNATFELPKFVNDFDNELEMIYLCRAKALSIIADVSAGKIDPIQGLKYFLMMMENTFAMMQKDKRFYKNLLFDKSFFSRPPQAIAAKCYLLNIIKKGTLLNKLDETRSVNEGYIAMLLQLTPQEIAMSQHNFEKREIIFQTKMLDLQQEIISTPSAQIALKKS